MKVVKEDYQKSRNYMLLLKGGGPGSVLEIGSDVSALCVITKPATCSLMKANDKLLFRWEKKLVKDDVSLLLGYQQSQLPEVEKRVKKLNKITSRAFVDSLLAYGWKYSELMVINSELTVQLRKYVDLNQLALDERQEGVSFSGSNSQTTTPREESESSQSSYNLVTSNTVHKRYRNIEVDVQTLKRPCYNTQNQCMSIATAFDSAVSTLMGSPIRTFSDVTGEIPNNPAGVNSSAPAVPTDSWTGPFLECATESSNMISGDTVHVTTVPTDPWTGPFLECATD